MRRREIIENEGNFMAVKYHVEVGNTLSYYRCSGETW